MTKRYMKAKAFQRWVVGCQFERRAGYCYWFFKYSIASEDFEGLLLCKSQQELHLAKTVSKNAMKMAY